MARSELLRLKRETHMRDFFGTLKGPSKQKLDYLERTVQDCGLALCLALLDGNPAVESGSFMLGSAPALVSQINLDDDADACCFSLDWDIIPVPLQTLLHTILLVSSSAIHDELCSLWAPRRNHHSGVSTGSLEACFGLCWQVSSTSSF